MMLTLLRLVLKIPMPAYIRLPLQRTLISRSYSTEILEAEKINDSEKAQSLRYSYQHEFSLHEEEEDSYLTRQLLNKARRLRIPVPHIHNEQHKLTSNWYLGEQTGGWYLTTEGINFMRQEIRGELKARHEIRAQWSVWFSALTGVIGAITGLVALILNHK